MADIGRLAPAWAASARRRANGEVRDNGADSAVAIISCGRAVGDFRACRVEAGGTGRDQRKHLETARAQQQTHAAGTCPLVVRQGPGLALHGLMSAA